MERWDAYDRNLCKIPNVVLTRGEAIPKGVFHLVSEVLVQHTDGTYLLMQRDAQKAHGGMWEATAGGSALQGETPLDCAVRELYEETGIRSDTLREIGRVRTHDTVYVEFFCATDCDKDSVVLQRGETVAYKWNSNEELLAMKKDTLLTRRILRFVQELQAPR